jgi:acid-sensing ion channel, other
MPYESPQFLSKDYKIPMKKSFKLNITPRMMMTSPEMRSYLPTKRNCYYSDEQRLKYFKQYTQSNCEIECLADIVLEDCNCLPLFVESNGELLKLH